MNEERIVFVVTSYEHEDCLGKETTFPKKDEALAWAEKTDPFDFSIRERILEPLDFSPIPF